LPAEAFRPALAYGCAATRSHLVPKGDVLDPKRHFHPGDRVTVSALGAGPRLRGAFRIMAVLPPEGGDNRYRVKSDLEQYERVVGESRLIPAK
jgi:hypothetical protein